MLKPRALTPDEVGEYLLFRREMLTDAPWAFGSSPDDDQRSETAVRDSLARAGNVIMVVRGQGADGVEGGGPLLASAGLHREERLKRRHVATIWGVYVRPEARGRGLGRAVVSAAVDVARAWGGVEVVQLTVSEQAPAARRIYESLGFVAWGREPDALRACGRSYAEVHMQLAL